MGKCTTVGTQLDDATAANTSHAAQIALDGTNITNIITLLNDIRSRLIGDYLVSKPGLAIGTDTTAVSNVAFTYTINGIQYAKAAVAAGVEPGNDVVPQNLYGAVALDVDSAGTVTIAEAAANATGYASAALAIAGIPAVAADKVRMGTVTAIKTDGAFTFGTTALNAANSTVVYTDATPGMAGLGAAVTEV